MLVTYCVNDFDTGNFIYEEFDKVDEEKYMSKTLDSFDLMKKSLKITINAIRNNTQFNGCNFSVLVKDISGQTISSFNFMQVYTEDDNKNG